MSEKTTAGHGAVFQIALAVAPLTHAQARLGVQSLISFTSPLGRHLLELAPLKCQGGDDYCRERG